MWLVEADNIGIPGKIRITAEGEGCWVGPEAGEPRAEGLRRRRRLAPLPGLVTRLDDAVPSESRRARGRARSGEALANPS